MSGRREALFWLAGIALFSGFLLLTGDILLPFVAGMAIAYFLDPVADKLEAWGMSRIWATTVIMLSVFVMMIAGLLALVPLLQSQIETIAKVVPAYSAKIIEVLDEITDGAFTALVADGEVPREGIGAELARSTIQWGMSIAREAVNQGVALFNLMSLLVITPIVAFYLLLDWDRMMARIDSWLPREHRQTIVALGHEVDRRMAGFVRGTGVVCISLGSFYAISLTLLGLEFGFIVGAIAGAVSFVPFLGFIVGFILSGLLALVQFWPDYLMIGAVAAVFLTGQVIEGNFLTPKFVGRNVGLHPVFVIFALLAFGALFGFVGVLIAVPMAAAIGVLVRFSIERYLASGFYRGADGG